MVTTGKSSAAALLMGITMCVCATAHAQSYQWPGDIRVHLPDGPVNGAVVILHGAGQDADTVFRLDRPMGQWRPIGDREGLLVIAPQAGGNRQWQDCSSRRTSSGDSPPDHSGQLRALVADIRQQHDLPPNRVFLAGVSNGGGMAMRAGRDFGDELGGIASVLGRDPSSEADLCAEGPAGLPFMLIHGTDDPVAPYDGDGEMAGAPESFENWSRRNGVVSLAVQRYGIPARARLSNPGVDCEYRQRSLSGRSTAMLCTVDGGGHLEPSIAAPYGAGARVAFGNQNRRVETAELMWAFLADLAAPRSADIAIEVIGELRPFVEESGVINWTASNAESCTLDGDWQGTGLSGQRSVRFDAAREWRFVVRCTSPDRRESERELAVTIQPRPEPPRILRLESDGEMTRAVGDSTTISWQAVDAEGCDLSGDWSGRGAPQGSRVVSLDAARRWDFILRCDNTLGAAHGQP